MGHSEVRARSLSDEVFWLRHALEVSKAGKEKLKARLAKLRAAGATLSKLPFDEAAQLRAALRRSRRQKTTIEALRKDNARLRRTMRKLETRKAALEVQPAKLRAIRKALESELAGLRAVRKTLSKSLSVADADPPQGSAKVAAPEGHDQVAVPGERPPAQGREDVAEPDRDTGSPA